MTLQLQLFALVVAIYGPTETFNHRPHTFARFLDRAACERAAEHFEARPPRPSHSDFRVAVCVEQPAPTTGMMVW